MTRRAGRARGDLPSVERAAAELRRAGFRDVDRATGRCSSTRFGVDGYIGFLTEFDEEDLFASWMTAGAASILATLRERLRRSSPSS